MGIGNTRQPAAGASARSLATDRRAVPEYRALAGDLRAQVRGEVLFDEYAQILYATDGSIYQARPAGVVAPRDADDVRAAVTVASDHGVPILPRGAGSSLAGQAVGPGCVVLDFTRHMDNVLEVDPDAKRARVQPGVVQDHLDAELAEYGLKFAPDPASSNRATIGGGIGNNSTGAHSVRYGITDAYTEELRVVLANGDLIHTREVVLDSPEYDRIVGADTREAELYRTVRTLVEEHSAEIDERYPTLKRSVSGYNLQKAIYENGDGERVINLSKLFVGAEGTLGVVVGATLSLVTSPGETAIALYCFGDLIEALEAVPVALDHPVSAVELMDDELFRLAREPSGRAAYSLGFLDRAREQARANVDALAPLVAEGWSILFVEPSDAVVFQDEYLDLLDGEGVQLVAGASYGVMEYLDRARIDEVLSAETVAVDAPDETLTYHGHCNQKAIGSDHHAVGVLRRLGYEVDPLDSGCCGMAGSFGYEAEHYDLSQAIGGILFDQVDASEGSVVTAPGASCRTQLGDRPEGERPPHPIQKVAEAID